MNSRNGHQKLFSLLLFITTPGFCQILSPLSGAMSWGIILVILFQLVRYAPVAQMNRRPNLTTFTTLTLIILIAILPIIFMVATIVQEIGVTYQQIQGTRPNYSGYPSETVQALSTWVQQLFAKTDLTNIAGIQRKFANDAVQISQFAATKALSIGQNTFQFAVSSGVMLYMVFSLLRDGADIGRCVCRVLSIDKEHKRLLLNEFTAAVHAAVKGNIAVALVQGVLDRLTLWFLDIDGAML